MAHSKNPLGKAELPGIVAFLQDLLRSIQNSPMQERGELVGKNIGHVYDRLRDFGLEPPALSSLVPLIDGKDVWAEPAVKDVIAFVRREISSPHSAETAPGVSKPGTHPIRPGRDSTSPVFTIDRWSSLGIGISEESCYLALSPCPANGEPVRVTEAVQLELRGKRWLKVLQLLARSPDGRTARMSDLVTDLGYFKNVGRRISEEQAEYDEGLKREAKSARGALRSAMADLGRELRQLIATEDTTTVFEMSGENYQAAFTVGFLLQDQNRRTEFSWGSTL
jgi:hypothetical protein